MEIELTLDKNYKNLLREIKTNIRAAQVRASLAVNKEVIHLYWDIGKKILEKQKESKWGEKLIEVLSHDLQNEFPETSGFSVRNLQRMQQFARLYQTDSIAPQLVAQLPWGQVSVLLQIKDTQEREWYALKALEHGLLQHVTKFLTKLGKGFAFLGAQIPIVIDDEEFFIDLLFYHVKLYCYCVVELKSTRFKPAHAGQLNFYLSAVDSKIKGPKDNPSIGILLCKSRHKVVAEYSLRDIEKTNWNF